MSSTSHRSRRSVFVVVAGCVAAMLGVGGSTIAAAQTTYPGCHTSQLSLWRGDPGTGTAGSVYYELQFSNISSHTCSLHGFPGVSAVTSHGAQLGSAAARDHRFAPTTVVLAPGTTAHAVLRIVNVANFSAASCQPTTAAALRIYPPNATSAALLPFRFRACSKPGPIYLYVRTVRPHAGVPGYSQ